MLQEKLIGAAVRDRDAYNEIARHETLFKLARFHKIVWDGIADYYETDPDIKEVDTKLLIEKLKTKHPDRAPHLDAYKFANGSMPNIMQVVKGVVRESKLRDIEEAIRDNDLDKAEANVHRFIEAVVEDTDQVEVFNDTQVAELLERQKFDHVIPVAPKWLNEQIGGLPPGTQMGVIARPDVGKTVVAINQAVVATCRGKVLFLSNEDPDSVMLMRIMSRFCKWPKGEIIAKPDEAYELAKKNGYAKLYFKSLTPGNIKEIRRLVEKVEPVMLCVDQVRNLSVYGAEGITDVLTKAPIHLRQLAKANDMVSLIVTQAGDSGHNKLVLDYTDVEYSNTGFAAQLDLMLGVGQNSDLHRDGYVSISFPKNKFSEPLEAQQFQINYAINWIG